jgi:hypothetical protein
MYATTLLDHVFNSMTLTLNALINSWHLNRATHGRDLKFSTYSKVCYCYEYLSI